MLRFLVLMLLAISANAHERMPPPVSQVVVPQYRQPYFPSGSGPSAYVPSAPGQRSVQFNGITIPEGGRIVCVKTDERPSRVKRCADGSYTVSTRSTMCENPVEVYDVQVSSAPPPESFVSDVLGEGGKRQADRLHRCFIYVPPAKR